MGFFDVANRYAGLDAKNDPLLKIDDVVPWIVPRVDCVTQAGSNTLRASDFSPHVVFPPLPNHKRVNPNSLKSPILFGPDMKPAKSYPSMDVNSVESAAIRITNLEHTYASQQGDLVKALMRISLTVVSGEFLAIVGPSGCGKTTLLNVVGGLLEPTVGEVLVNSRPPQAGHPDLGYLFARDGLLPWRTASRNVGLPLEIRGVGRKERDSRAAAMLAAVGLEDFADSHPSELSQGMRQRVALARMLVTDPKTLLMDEPFSALDAQTRLLMHLHFLSIWEKHNSTVLLITHDLGEAITLADRVIVFSRRPGRIKGEFQVDLPRPRRVADLQANAAYHDLFRRIWTVLEEELIADDDRERRAKKESGVDAKSI